MTSRCSRSQHSRAWRTLRICRTYLGNKVKQGSLALLDQTPSTVTVGWRGSRNGSSRSSSRQESPDAMHHKIWQTNCYLPRILTNSCTTGKGMIFELISNFQLQRAPTKVGRNKVRSMSGEPVQKRGYLSTAWRKGLRVHLSGGVLENSPWFIHKKLYQY